MLTIFSTAVLIGTVALFAADKKGKTNLNETGRLCVYTIIPVAAALFFCLNVMSLAIDVTDPDTYASVMSDVNASEELAPDPLWRYFKSNMAQLIMLIPTYIIAFIGCLSAVKNEVYAGKKDEVLKKAVRMIIAGTVFSAVSAVFALIVVYVAGSFAISMIGLLVVAVCLSLVSCGVFAIVFAVIVPIMLLFAGTNFIIVCLPYATSSFIWGSVFVFMHILALCMIIFVIRQMYTENHITKNKSIIFGILSAVPVINLVIIIKLRKKLKDTVHI